MISKTSIHYRGILSQCIETMHSQQDSLIRFKRAFINFINIHFKIYLAFYDCNGIIIIKINFVLYVFWFANMQIYLFLITACFITTGPKLHYLMQYICIKKRGF